MLKNTFPDLDISKLDYCTYANPSNINESINNMYQQIIDSLYNRNASKEEINNFISKWNVYMEYYGDYPNSGIRMDYLCEKVNDAQNTCVGSVLSNTLPSNKVYQDDINISHILATNPVDGTNIQNLSNSKTSAIIIFIIILILFLMVVIFLIYKTFKPSAKKLNTKSRVSSDLSSLSEFV
jgi:hypothetical protein